MGEPSAEIEGIIVKRVDRGLFRFLLVALVFQWKEQHYAKTYNIGLN